MTHEYQMREKSSMLLLLKNTKSSFKIPVRSAHCQLQKMYNLQITKPQIKKSHTKNVNNNRHQTLPLIINTIINNEPLKMR